MCKDCEKEMATQAEFTSFEPLATYDEFEVLEEEQETITPQVIVAPVQVREPIQNTSPGVYAKTAVVETEPNTTDGESSFNKSNLKKWLIVLVVSVIAIVIGGLILNKMKKN